AHYDWLIETFWTHFLGVVGGVLLLVVMGVINAAGMFFLVLMALLLFAFGYPIYRLVKGYMALSAGRGPDEGGQAVW
ncbi:MAG TPA: hypothetical protein VFS20_09930, partial [Longimicrobium sp.]|nr:hypothetical protein [Longimicrobium sp.]